jgi:hypothetical protein
MLGGDAPAGNPISCPGLRVASQTSTMAGGGGIAAAGNLIVASVSVVIPVLGETGVAIASLAGNRFTSCAWLVSDALVSIVSVRSVANARRTITVILLVSRHAWSRRRIDIRNWSDPG